MIHKSLWIVYAYCILVCLLPIGCNELYVSKNDQAQDKPSCGTKLSPCYTIQYTVNNRVDGYDTILLDGGSANYIFLYTINETIILRKSVNFSGLPNTPLPVIKASYIISEKSKPLFSIEADNVNFSSIFFRRFYVLLHIENNTKTTVQFHGCNLTKFDTLFSSTCNNVNLELDSCNFDDFDYALLINGTMNISISKSIFSGQLLTKKTDYFRQIAITMFANSFNLVIKDSLFQYLTRSIAIDAGTCDLSHGTITVFNTSFLFNYLRFHDVYESNIFVCGDVHLDILNSYFNGNIAMKGGAIDLECPSTIKIRETVFVNNSAVYEGGAVTSNAKTAIISNCNFTDNYVDPTLYHRVIPATGENEPTTSRDGGAIKNYGNMTIDHCVFTSNSAPAFGGSIYHTSRDDRLNQHLIIKDTIINGPKSNLSYVGSLIYSNTALGMINVTLNVVNAINYGSVIYYYDVVSVKGHFHRKTPFEFVLNCPKNYKLTSEKVRSASPYMKTYFSLIYFCSVCNKGTYSIEFEKEHFDSNKVIAWNKTSLTCHSCPVGASCDNGVVSNDNFYGYVSKKNSLEFLNCPPEYCCSAYSNQCKSHNTCNFNRVGKLCGQCKEGMSENLISTRCIPNKKCSSGLFWFLAFIGALVYLAVIIYLKDITSYLKKAFKSSHKVTPLTQRLIPHRVEELENDERVVEDDDCPDIHLAPIDDNTSGYITSGVLKILVFYYQIEFLLQINSASKKYYAVFTLWKDIASSVINVNPSFVRNDKAEGRGIVLCPYPNMGPVLKVLLKASLIAFIFFILLVIYVISACVSRNKDKQEDEEKEVIEVVDLYVPKYAMIPFTLRLKCGFLQLILLVYTPATTYMFRMLNCVQMGDEKRLHINAEVICWQWWQLAIATGLALWLLPFTLTLYWSIDLLKKCRIRPNEFLRDMIFPLFTIYHYVKSKFYRQRTFLTLKEAKSSKHLLMVFDDPFREKYAKWEGILLLRKIVLVVLNVYIINPVVRLYVMLFMLTIFLLDHLRVQPYKGKFLNWFETISLMLLCSFASINLYWAEGFMYNVVPQSELLGEIFIAAEIFVLALPLIAIFIFLIVVLIKKIYNCFY